MDENVISGIKALALDMIDEANSGHPGIVLGAAPILYTLYANHMNINPKDDKWINRDRFVMSAGHGSALLYSTLYMAGYDLSLDDLKKFRTLNSKTPGHPEYGVTPGVDMSTGLLGQGFASAVGMAISEKIMHEQTKIDNNSLIDYNVYVLCSDGDLMEGISYEAASLAGTLNLNNLIVLYDSNNISLDGKTNMTFSENITNRFRSMGWDTFFVKKPSIRNIDKAINKAKKSNRPCLIEVKTKIGKGSILENTNQVHGKPLSKDDLNKIKEKLFIPKEKFFENNDLKTYMNLKIKNRVEDNYNNWFKEYQNFLNSNMNKDIVKLINKQEEINILNYDFSFKENLCEELRITNKRILNELVKFIPNFIGGSADLAIPTNTYLENCGDLTSDNFLGKNIWFGVREYAMGAILNGMALEKFRVFGSTFLSFSDLLKPAIRMSSIMNLPVTYIFTHDSISIGEDGVTHQPIEQLSMLRSIPNLNLFRPADANELIGCWNEILNSNKNPSVLVISKEKLPILNVSKKEFVNRGAYVIETEHNRLDGIIIATGSEVHTALNISRDLYLEYGIELRVVSMPCKELFLKQSQDYKELILPTGCKKIVIEAGCKYGWESFVYNDKYLITLDSFGKSGHKEEVLKYMNFDYDTIKERILNLIRRG